MPTNYSQLIEIFQKNILGKRVPLDGHDGFIGHWIERQFGVSANGECDADWNGFELKTGKAKTSFGDWSADHYLWKEDTSFSGTNREKRDSFLGSFGAAVRADRPGRFSWSGKAFPKVGQRTLGGQIMSVNDNMDIEINYDFSLDRRHNRGILVPRPLQRDGVVLARWTNNSSPKSLKNRVEKKFGQRGWVKLVQNRSRIFVEMQIGPPITFSDWIADVKAGAIFLDSGMYQGNSRPYQNWRADNKYWLSKAHTILN